MPLVSRDQLSEMSLSPRTAVLVLRAYGSRNSTAMKPICYFNKTRIELLFRNGISPKILHACGKDN